MLDLGDYGRKAVKFMIIGALGTVVNLGVLYFLVEYFKVWYIFAEIIAILIAFGVNFNGNILVRNIKIGKSEAKKVSPTPEIEENRVQPAKNSS